MNDPFARKSALSNLSAPTNRTRVGGMLDGA
jgi:hypothetical protein